MARTDGLIYPNRAVGVTVMVTLMHLGVLAYLVNHRDDGHPPQGGASAAMRAHHWKMRWVGMPQQPTRALTRAPMPEQDAPSSEPLALITTPSLLTSDVAPDAPAPEVQVAEAPDESTYLPRAALSKGPRAIGIIDIPFPEGLVGHGHYESTLALYIDETGAVRKVEVTGQELPPPLEEAARLTFMKASFTPGEKDGVPVKTKIVVEVVFDDTEPLASPQANASSSAATAG